MECSDFKHTFFILQKQNKVENKIFCCECLKENPKLEEVEQEIYYQTNGIYGVEIRTSCCHSDFLRMKEAIKWAKSKDINEYLEKKFPNSHFDNEWEMGSNTLYCGLKKRITDTFNMKKFKLNINQDISELIRDMDILNKEITETLNSIKPY